MTYDQVLRHYGSIREMAYVLGYTEQGVRNWQKQSIPIRTQLMIQAMTNGKLQAENEAKKRG